MTDRTFQCPASAPVIFHPPHGYDEQVACFPVIAELRPFLKDADEWCDRASTMAKAGYQVLAAWNGDRVLAVAGYRILENLIHHRFLYVDDLVTAKDHRGKGLGAELLRELSAVARAAGCQRLVIDTAITNESARHFYSREGLREVIVGLVKPLEGDQ